MGEGTVQIAMSWSHVELTQTGHGQSPPMSEEDPGLLSYISWKRKVSQNSPAKVSAALAAE